MGKLLNIVGVAIATSVASKVISHASKFESEETKRSKIICNFEDGISQDDFNKIVQIACQKVNRLKHFKTVGAIVYGSVNSLSGMSSWDFKLDFNDYGHLTGQYWIYSDNYDSNIPEFIAKHISNLIADFPNSINNSNNDSNFKDNIKTTYCPYCGKKSLFLKLIIVVIVGEDSMYEIIS